MIISAAAALVSQVPSLDWTIGLSLQHFGHQCTLFSFELCSALLFRQLQLYFCESSAIGIFIITEEKFNF